MITIISFIHKEAGKNGKRLENNLKGRFPKIEQEFYDSGDNFQKRLGLPNFTGKKEIYVVLAESLERLGELLALRKLLEDRRLVLILPENHKTIISMGQRLLPRYVCSEPENHDEVVSVLEKMIEVMVADEGRGENVAGCIP